MLQRKRGRELVTILILQHLRDTSKIKQWFRSDDHQISVQNVSTTGMKQP